MKCSHFFFGWLLSRVFVSLNTPSTVEMTDKKDKTPTESILPLGEARRNLARNDFYRIPCLVPPAIRNSAEKMSHFRATWMQLDNLALKSPKEYGMLVTMLKAIKPEVEEAISLYNIAEDVIRVSRRFLFLESSNTCRVI